MSLSEILIIFRDKICEEKSAICNRFYEEIIEIRKEIREIKNVYYKKINNFKAIEIECDEFDDQVG